MIAGGPSVTALGGGHGLATTLTAARRYAGRVTAVVSVADDGGSSGRLREISGIPAPGDLRRCLGALAAEPDSVWARAFEYRFPDGELGGHALGNLVIAALAEVGGDFAAALGQAALLLGVEGRVLPATIAPADVVAWINGREVVGQVKVAASAEQIERLSVRAAGLAFPPGHGAGPGPNGGPRSDAVSGSGSGAVSGSVAAPLEAVEAVTEADQVVLGPGSLYTSILATAVVPDLARALAERQGGRVFVANLRAVEPEAGGYGAADQLRVLLDHGVSVDTMVYDPASAVRAGGDLGDRTVGTITYGVRCVAAGLAGQGGWGHDPARLAEVLADLA